MLRPGSLIDRYVVEELLGEGGMAVVYRVRHRKLGTVHAIKLLRSVGGNLVERLEQEGRAQAQLRHPNVVAVTDVIQHQGVAGLVMEYVEGPSLEGFLARYQPTLDEALAIFRGVLAGVGAAHERGLVHRDLKPGNILLKVTEEGVVPQVADFGLVKDRSGPNQTRSGSTMGTPAYMAPEQIRDASQVDRRADLYSLGVMLYELVCGTVPYKHTDLFELFNLVIKGKRVAPEDLCPGLPSSVRACIDGLMEVDVDLRITDCASALEVLAGVEMEELTDGIDLVGQEQYLAHPRSMPVEIPNSSLAIDGPGMNVARSLVRTPVPVMADPSTLPALVVSLEQSSPVWRWAGGLLLLMLVVGTTAAVTGTGVAFIAAWWPAPVADVVALQDTDVARVVEPAVPTEPIPSPAAPVPEPVVSVPSVRPSPSLSAPRPVRPAPKLVQPVVVRLPTGTYLVERDEGTQHVYIESNEGSFQPGAAVPVGSYRVFARFRGEPVRRMAVELKIEESHTSVLKCAFRQLRCTVKQ